MKPSKVSAAIEARVKEQIKRSLPIHTASEELGRKLDDFLESEYPLCRPPYLEAVPSYQPGESLAELAREGVIAQRTAQIFARYFLGNDNADPAAVTLHAHQAEAVREACQNGKNLVVCSGTGSGKTECFLIPLIDSLVREMEENNGCLVSGVRAMILYPMNALVNDQIRRLRNVLRWEDKITFGKFIGETAKDDELAGEDVERIEQGLAELPIEEGYRQFGFDDEGSLSNEVRTRAKFRSEPAHILVTNYSMLERLLLQPVNQRIFGEHWRFIVLDEAHCYSGALGTEIAWLVRRVKRRVQEHGTPVDRLRFFATSATLISDDKLTPAEKQERIQQNFASRLFPAHAESFAVQFGRLADAETSQLEGECRSAADFVELVNLPFGKTTLIADSESLLARKSWREHLLGQLDALLKGQNGNAAIGDLLAVTAVARAASSENELWDSLLNPQGDNSGILDHASSAAVEKLREILITVIGSLNDWDNWRKWLHDEGDLSPSSVADDTYKRNGVEVRKAQGNRLHLLSKWRQPVENWSWEALGWMLRIATELASNSDAGIDPGAVQVTMSESCRVALTDLKEQLERGRAADEDLEKNLDQKWAQALNSQPTGRFRQTLAETFKGESKLITLRTELRQATSASQADRATSTKLAENLFNCDPEALAGLDALVALGTLAQESGKRTPLLDIRYHQIIRGVRAPGLHLSCNVLKNTVDTELLRDTIQRGLTLGLCRDCGQPFALGYMEGPAIVGAGPHRVSAARSRGREYLHAFAWCDEGGATPNQDALWLNTAEGLFVQGGLCPGDGFVPLVHHASPENNYREFVKKCPCCQTDQNPMANSKYGIITPFEASGDSLRMVAMEELARQSGPSGDPVARKLPGEGRKLLVFSDSRIGSAGLALSFQEYHAETILEPLLGQASKDASLAVRPSDQQVLLETGEDECDWDDIVSDPKAMERSRRKWEKAHPQIPTFARVSEQLAKQLEEHNLAGLLSVAEVQRDPNTNQELPIGELDLKDAARWRLLQALTRSGRHSARRKKLLRLANPILENPDQETLDALGGVSPEVFSRMVDALISWCLDRVQVQIQDGYPLAGIQRFQGTVSRDGVGSSVRWATNSENSKLLKYLRTVICTETDFWKADLQLALKSFPAQPAPHKQLADRILDDPDFDKIIRDICCAPTQGASVDVLPDRVKRNATSACMEAVAKTIRQNIGEKAALWLKIVWRLFSQNDNGQFAILCGNDEYRLNPEALLIYPGDDSQRSDRELIPLRIEEHTAQLAKTRGSDYQRAFALGRINILSCSTTFEMGVDLGDLSCVFLNGMPPSVANYRQRAGRAGRRPGSPSYVLTFLGDADHDRYFWEHTEQLLFAALEEPRIYLDNPIYRARHLRAEAFHDFVRWLEQGDRLDDVAATIYTHASGQISEKVGTKKRKWTTVGDLLVGLGASRRAGGSFPVKWRFTPLVEQFYEWLNDRSAKVQDYVSGIDGIGNDQPGYRVAEDLVWQIKKQDLDKEPIAPFDLAADEAGPNYRLLGGPNWPEFADENVRAADDVRRRSIQEQALRFFPTDTTHVEGFQRHLLGEQTITWLSRTRILPKYGFPVDVIQLMPHREDPHGNNVKLERDLKVGIVEYAPGQVIVADKRTYRSREAVVWQDGQFSSAGGALVQRLICQGCHEPSWEGKDGDQCRYCGGALTGVNLCFPDAFRADRSTPAMIRRGERGTPVHAHTRAFPTNGRQVNGTGLVTKESESGSITYINQGPAFRWGQPGDTGFALCHEVRTDIAGWMFSKELFTAGGFLRQWSLEGWNGRGRLAAAMKSALYAIVRALARVKQIEERDIRGILQPGDGAQGELGIVLFDDSTGGGGAVMDLVLCGNEVVDAERSELINKILARAIKDLESCSTCRAADSAQMMPVTHDEWLAMNEAEREVHRHARSCYYCLRSHSNQRDHALLDCEDAIGLIRAIAAFPNDPN